MIIDELKYVSLYKLTKLLYLIDYNYYKDFGHSMSSSIYLRMQEGPWVPMLRNIVNEYENKLFFVTFNKKKPVLTHIANEYKTKITDEQKQYIKTIINKYIDCTDATMKIAAYRTPPMRYIIEQERIGRNMSRMPILYKDSSILDISKENKSKPI